jgi:uncharacterized membrane protein YdjX (TVP38/TMEM64 family)
MSRPASKITLLAFAAGALALAAALLLLLNAHWDLRAQFQRTVEFFREAGAVPFFIAMALLPAAGFPLGMFTIAAAVVFSPTLGLPTVLACTLLAVAVNVALSYWIAARALRPLVLSIVQRFGYTLPEVQSHTAWTIILLVRVVPGPPFFVQSYLLGLARVPFRPYMLISTLVPAAYLIGTLVFADALARGDGWAMAGAVAVFVVVGAILHQVRRRLTAARDNAEAATDAAASLPESRN